MVMEVVVLISFPFHYYSEIVLNHLESFLAIDDVLLYYFYWDYYIFAPSLY
jgi:hypothetical protein